MEIDDYLLYIHNEGKRFENGTKISKSRLDCRMSTDDMTNDELDEYCRKHSGEVKVFNITDLQQV